MANRPLHRISLRGTTLIEAMVSVAVFSIGLLGLIGMNNLASAQNALADRQTISTEIGRDLIDAFERLPFDHSSLNPAGNPHTLKTEWGAAERPLIGAAVAAVTADGHIQTGASRYSVSWDVENRVNAAGELEAKVVRFQVTMRITASTTKTLTFHTVKYNPVVVVGPTASGFSWEW